MGELISLVDSFGMILVIETSDMDSYFSLNYNLN